MTRKELIRKVLGFINLDSEVDDFDVIHDSIEKGIIFRGTNLWILVFAIIIASVGLNMNSTAVIIGAMLISPLMGPINGMGYSLATYNFPLFRKSVKNFSFAVVASLVASTAYFTMSPISTAHSELLARTSPTIYDVLIALFGGLAGILAISSKQKGNVIPGVAIATALMPPLCTAGYGLATAQYNYFFGAFYLFTINAAFIGISSIIISQVLKFPTRQDISKEQKLKVNRLTSIFIVIILIPSVYFGYKLVEKEKFTENANRYVSNVSVIEGNYLLNNEINPKERTIKLVYGGISMGESQKALIIAKAKDFALQDTKIEFHQGLSFDENNKQKSEVENLKAELSRLNLVVKYKEQQVDSIKKSNIRGKQILDEIKTLYPQIVNCSYSNTYEFEASKATMDRIEIVVLSIKGSTLSHRDQEKIENWLRSRLKSEKIKVFYDRL